MILGVMFGVLLVLSSGQNSLNVSAANKRCGDLHTAIFKEIDMSDVKVISSYEKNKILNTQRLNSSTYSSTTDYYNMLDSTGKAYYTALATAYSNPNAYGTSDVENPGIISGVTRLDSDYFNMANECYLYDHLDELNGSLCYLVGGSYSGSFYLYAVYVSSSYTSSTVATMESNLESARSSFVSAIGSISDPVELEETIHNKLCGSVSYDYSSADYDVAHTAYGALVDGSAVCDGYSTAYAYIMDYYDIPTRVCVGYANGDSVNGGHAWNIVELDNEWYEVDCTWDDEGSESAVIYDYFNLTTTTISIDHTRDYEGTLLPTATGTKYAYANISGVTLSTTDVSMYKNETCSLTYTYTPASLGRCATEWSSSDTSIATVDSSGLVTAVGQGTCTITLTATYNTSCTASATITVDGVVYSTGTTIKDSSGTKYKVTGDDTVTYAAPENKKVKSVTIPATVTIDGITYDVTDVSKNAFKNCKKLKKVNVGKNITSIGKNSFYNCTSLKKIVIKSKSITSIGKNSFKNINSNAVIKVPKSKYKAYKKLFKKSKLSSTVTVKKY